MKMKMDKWKTRQQYAGPVIALSVVWMCGLDVFMFMWLEPDGHVICRTEKREAQARVQTTCLGPTRRDSHIRWARRMRTVCSHCMSKQLRQTLNSSPPHPLHTRLLTLCLSKDEPSSDADDEAEQLRRVVSCCSARVVSCCKSPKRLVSCRGRYEGRRSEGREKFKCF